MFLNNFSKPHFLSDMFSSQPIKESTQKSDNNHLSNDEQFAQASLKLTKCVTSHLYSIDNAFIPTCEKEYEDVTKNKPRQRIS